SFSCSLRPPPPSSRLFPYTTLFRSQRHAARGASREDQRRRSSAVTRAPAAPKRFRHPDILQAWTARDLLRAKAHHAQVRVVIVGKLWHARGLSAPEITTRRPQWAWC